MNEQRAMLAETVDRLFGELMAGGMPEADSDACVDWWRRIEELGLTDVFLPESAGGFGGGWADACVVFNMLGLHALPLPLGETLIARKLLQEAGITAPAGMMSIAVCADAEVQLGEGSTGLLLSGTLTDVPWGGAAQWLAVAARWHDEEQLVLLAGDQCKLARRRHNEADEPRDSMVVQGASVIASAPVPDCMENMQLFAALLRSAQIAGALEASLEMTVEYVNQREQFGRPLSKFQALQHQLALLAEEAAAVKCAAQAASRCADQGDARFEIAAAKLRANRAVGEATSIAHQTHGAIGFTREHHLHFWTQRLWSWRSEYGNDRYWSNLLGKLVLQEGAANFWQNLTARGDR